MERNEATSKTHLLKLFPDYGVNAVSEYESNPTNPETGNRLSKRLVEWLKSEIGNWYSYERFLVNLSWPNIETVESRMMIKLWLNQDDRKKGQSARRVMKPGKALRHLFPWLNDSQIEFYVDRMRLELGERQYTLKTGTDAESFTLAYTGQQCRMENPNTTSYRKSLANSCMRYDSIMHHDCDNDLRHPVEAYASGEFTIVYVTDQKGHVAARCVVWNGAYGKPVAAPIYGVCEASMNLVENYLQSINALYEGQGDWIGASLKAIEGKHGGYIAPYLDLCPQSLDIEGDSLVVTRHGDINASDYSGLLDGEPESMCTCENCGDRYDAEDEGGFVDERSVCDSCYQDSYYCEFYGEHTFQDCETVYLWRWGRRHEEIWCDSAISDNAESVDGNYWRTSDLLGDYDGEYITPEQVDDGEYFLSDWSGEFYPIETMCETDSGEIVSKIELDDDKGIWEQDSRGIWHNVQLELGEVA